MIVKKCLALVLVLMMAMTAFVGMIGSVQATDVTYFNDGLESYASGGTFSGASRSSATLNNWGVLTTDAHSGGKCLYINQAVTGWCYVPVSFPSVGTAYKMDFWMKSTNSYNYERIGFGLNGSSLSPSNIPGIAFSGNNLWVFNGGGWTGTYSTYSTTFLNNWHKVTISVNTAHTTASYYIDDVWKVDKTCSNHYAPTQLMMNDDAGNDAHACFDDFKIYTPGVPSWRPAFMSTPSGHGYLGQYYDYYPMTNVTSTFTANNKPAWASWDGTSFSGIPTAVGSYTFNVSATASGTVGVGYQEWTVYVGAWAPTITSIAKTSGYLGEAYSYHVTTNESATITALVLPSWASYSDGYITGYVQAGTNTVSLQAQSEMGTLYAWQNFTISIAKWAPHFTSVPETTVLATASYSYHVVTNETTTITILNAPSWLHYDNGYLNGTPVLDDLATVSIQAQSQHGQNYAWQNYTILVRSWAPEITSTPAVRVPYSSTYTYHITANETCYITVEKKPNWCEYSNGYFVGTIPKGQFDFAIKVTSMVGGKSVWQNFTVYSLSYYTGDEASGASEALPWSYNCNAFTVNGDVVIITNITVWAQQSGMNFTGMPQNNVIGWYWINVTVSLDGEYYYHNMTIVVKNVPPALENEPFAYYSQGKNYYADLNAVGEGYGVTYSMVCSSNELTIDPITGIISGNLTGYDDVTITVTVDDGHGAIVTKQFIITCPGVHTVDATTNTTLNLVLMFAFLVAMTCINLFGAVKRVPIIVLVCVAVNLLCVPIAFMLMPGMWFIPLFFVLINAVIGFWGMSK